MDPTRGEKAEQGHKTKTLAKLDTQVQNIQGDLDYSVPCLQQQVLDLNGVVAEVLRQNEFLMRQNDMLTRQHARMSQKIETLKDMSIHPAFRR